MPRNSGTTISPPGTRLTVLKIFMGAYSTCANAKRSDITPGLLENPLASPHAIGSRFAKWAAVCWIVVFWKLGAPALMDPDEAHYAQLTREMLQCGQLDDSAARWPAVHRQAGPVSLAAGARHRRARAKRKLAMRLPSAIAALALFWLTWWTGAQLFDDRASACARG